MGTLIGAASGLAGSLFGGSKEKSSQTQSSSNRSYDFLKDSLGGIIGQSGQASSQLANLLGLGGEPAQTGAFDNWRKNTGYNFGFNQGQDAITGSAAAKGLLNSGSTAKALSQFGQDYGATKYNDYLSQLSGLLGQGLQAGNVISGAGGVSQGQSSSSGSSNKAGFSGVVGNLLSKRK